MGDSYKNEGPILSEPIRDSKPSTQAMMIQILLSRCIFSSSSQARRLAADTNPT